MNREQAEQEIMKLVEAWIAAETRGDVTFPGKVLTDDFVGIGPLGFMLSKQEWIERHQSGDMKYESLTLDEVRVRVYNDAAILTGRQVQDAAYRGNSINARFRTTLVFVHQYDQWQLAGLQLSAIGQPPAFARQ